MFTGADPTSLDDAAAAFTRAAHRAEQVTQAVSRAAQDLAAHRMVFGPLADAYCAALVRDVLSPLSGCGERMRSFAGELAGHAEQQRRASLGEGRAAPAPLTRGLRLGSADLDAVRVAAAPGDSPNWPWTLLPKRELLPMERHVKEFFEGFLIDGLGESILDLYHLVAWWTPEFKEFWSCETWEALKYLATGWEDDPAGWREIMWELGKELFKDFVAWEQWEKGDYGKATGIVLYNVLATYLGLKAGKLLKAAVSAKIRTRARNAAVLGGYLAGDSVNATCQGPAPGS